MTTIDGPTAFVLWMIATALSILLYVWTAYALSAVFRKCGEEGWKAWVPFYGIAVLLRLGGLSPWLVLLVLIPFAGAVLVWALVVLAAHRLNRGFGFEGPGMTVLAILLPVWATIVGLGAARWYGETSAGEDDGVGPRRTGPIDVTSVGVAAGAEASASARPHPVADAFVPGAGFAVDEPRDGLDDPDEPEPAPIQPTVPVPRLWRGFDRDLAEGGEIPPLPSEPEGDDAGADDAAAPAPRERPAPPVAAPAAEQALYRAPEPEDVDDEPFDETIVVRRRRTPWSLVTPEGDSIALTADVVVLGRRPSADATRPAAQLVTIEHRTVSKVHALLELRDERWMVTDLGSTNGVLFATIMGTEVEAEPGVATFAGDRFLLGDVEVRLLRGDTA